MKIKKNTRENIAASRTRWPADKIVWNEMRKQKSKEKERDEPCRSEKELAGMRDGAFTS